VSRKMVKSIQKVRLSPVMVNRPLNFLSELKDTAVSPVTAFMEKLPLERMPNREPQNQ
jgi:hypothetical protein